MSNTHGVPDFASELQAIMGDLQSPCIISGTFPIVPVSSLTLAAFATSGFVKDGTQLVYVSQPAAAVTLSGADGQFWVALHRNTSTAVASWTRQAGSHYLWRSNPTQPADPSGGLVMSRVTVAGGVITVVDQVGMRISPLSLQDAASVTLGGLAVTGATSFTGQVFGLDRAGNDQRGFWSTMDAAGGTGRYGFLATGDADNYFEGKVGIANAAPTYPLDVTGNMRATSIGLGGALPGGAIPFLLNYLRSTAGGMIIKPDADTGSGVALGFRNAANSTVGSITTTASATAYNTSSDARLKENVEDLPNPLQVMAGLRPVAFRWKRTQAEGRGFLATEVAALVPEAVHGEPDAVDAAGEIIPQQVDYSKLVPYLVGAVKGLIALNAARVNQIQALTVRVAALEAR